MKIYRKFEKSDKPLIYIINNYLIGFSTDRIQRIKEIIKQENPHIELITIHFSQLDLKHLKKSKGFILSGSNNNVSDFYRNESLRKKYKLELKLIKKVKKVPILAICFGFHLVAYAFNVNIARMGGPDKGTRIIPISIKNEDEIVYQKDIFVDIHHLDYVSPEDSNIKKYFEIQSVAEVDGFKTIQYMYHSKKPIFATQFHPETHQFNYYYINSNDENLINKVKKSGEEIINNFIDFCIQRN